MQNSYTDLSARTVPKFGISAGNSTKLKPAPLVIVLRDAGRAGVIMRGRLGPQREVNGTGKKWYAETILRCRAYLSDGSLRDREPRWRPSGPGVLACAGAVSLARNAAPAHVCKMQIISTGGRLSCM